MADSAIEKPRAPSASSQDKSYHSPTRISSSENKVVGHDKGKSYLTGWRLHTLTLGDAMLTSTLVNENPSLTLRRLCLGIFLVNFEISIVSTSLVAITDDLKHFGQSSWVITAYLLTYTSFMIILAKLSDMFSRKIVLLLSVFIFTLFSGGCAAAQTMVQL